MSSVPSSSHASCLGKCFCSAKGRRDAAHVAVLVWAIMQLTLEFVIEVGIRASGGRRRSMMGRCLGGSERGNLYWIGFRV